MDQSRITIPSIVMGKKIDSQLNFDKPDSGQDKNKLDKLEIHESSLQNIVHGGGQTKETPYLVPYVEEPEEPEKKRPIFRTKFFCEDPNQGGIDENVQY